MKTTTMRTAGAIFSAGILLASCVSSKKYHRSQDEVAKLRNDSTTLAQQASTLQQNLTATEQKNADLQKSVETANTTNSGLQKNVAYYTDYTTKEQANTKQIREELNTTLAANGLTEQDIILTDGKIYVNIGEKSLFKGNSAMLTTKGKALVDNLGQFVKGHDAVDVSVADLEQSTGTADNSAMDNNGTASGTTAQNSTSTSSSSTATNNNADYTTAKNRTSDNTSMTTDKTAHKVAVHHRKKVHAATGEAKAVAYSSNRHNKYTAERLRRSTARAIAWKRQNAVADALLKTGIPKVKVVAQDQPETTGGQKGVQVVLVHGMDDFYKHMNEAPAAGQPVSKNP
jgi:outer membrane murein-binding lipoprotein Lpp